MVKSLLANYPRGANVRGVHWSGSTHHKNVADLQPVMAWLQAAKISWVKLLDDGYGSSLALCGELLRLGIIPVVRVYRHRPNPGIINYRELDTIKKLVAIGVRYVETNNEPNLPDEWSEGLWEKGGSPEVVAGHWLLDSKMVIEAGGLPAIPALAQCSLHGDSSSIRWYERFFGWLHDTKHGATEELLHNGVWLATHGAALNHWYADNTGWHFEYPYDPRNQKDHPGATVFQDDNSLMGYTVATKILASEWKVQIPVISTEGGIFTPTSNNGQFDDPRYGRYDEMGHGVGTVAMFEWLGKRPEYFGMCPWLLGNRALGHVTDQWAEASWIRDDGRWLYVADLLVATPAPVPPTPVPTKPLNDAVLDRAYDMMLVPRNPNTALYKKAKELNLGAPLTNEEQIEYSGVRYIMQPFAGGVLYVKVDDWGNVKFLSWR